MFVVCNYYCTGCTRKSGYITGCSRKMKIKLLKVWVTSLKSFLRNDLKLCLFWGCSCTGPLWALLVRTEHYLVLTGQYQALLGLTWTLPRPYKGITLTLPGLPWPYLAVLGTKPYLGLTCWALQSSYQPLPGPYRALTSTNQISH